MEGGREFGGTQKKELIGCRGREVFTREIME